MSALFDADGDQIAIGAITPSDEGTLAVWVYPTDDTARQNIWRHLTTASDLGIAWRADLAGDEFQGFRGGATYGEAHATAASFSVYGLNKWLLLVLRYGTTGPSSLWMGDETTTPAAPSAYTLQTTVVTPLTVSGTTLVGTTDTINTRWFRGRIGGYAWWNGTRLTDTEVGNWWADPFTGSFPAPSLFSKVDSLTSIADLTGNGNTGTGTGLSSLDSQPVILFPPLAVRTAWLRA